MKQERYSNALIYPAMRKVGTRDPYFTAYDYFQRCCERAGLCVVVGYSFRDYNALTRLRNAVRLNPLLELYLISPNALEIAGKELVGMKCRPIAMPFEGISHEILSEIKASIQRIMEARKKRDHMI